MLPLRPLIALTLPTLALWGCARGSADPPQELTSCRSWIATARITTAQWIDGSLTRVYARQTLETFEEELPKQMSKLPADTLRGRLRSLLPQVARHARLVARDVRIAIEALDRVRARRDLALLAIDDSTLAGAIAAEYPQ